MNVEIITPDADPDRGGFGLRVHGLASIFSRFADVRVVVTTESRGRRVPGVLYTHLPVRDGLGARLRRLRTYYRTGFPRRRSAAVPDLVLVESLDVLGLAQYGDRVPIVLDEHNVYWNLLRYDMVRAPFFRGPLGRRALVRRWLVPRLLDRAKAFEVAALRRAARTLVTSEADRREILAEVPDLDGRIEVLPNCVDADRIPYLAGGGEEREVLFVGNFNYVPNLEAAAFIERDLAPRLPAVRFACVGPDPPPQLSNRPNVVATGLVPDLEPFLRRAGVCIAPLANGSGTRLKILTYLAAGKAVVATTKACEGLPIEDGVHALIRDDPKAFAASVREALEDRELRSRLGARGRRLVEERFDWRVHVGWAKAFAATVCANGGASRGG